MSKIPTDDEFRPFLYYVVKSGFYASSTLFVVSAAMSIIGRYSVCDTDFVLWNAVACVLFGIKAASSGFLLHLSPITLESYSQALCGITDARQILKQGILAASAVLAGAVDTIIIFFWVVHGFSSAYGTCSNTAPLLFYGSVTEMIATFILVVGATGILTYKWAETTGCAFAECCTKAKGWVCGHSTKLCGLCPWNKSSEELFSA